MSDSNWQSRNSSLVFHIKSPSPCCAQGYQSCYAGQCGRPGESTVVAEGGGGWEQTVCILVSS